MGDLQSAEGLLLQNGQISEAIRINITTYRWSRALELAIKHKKLLDEVLEKRKQYLALLGKPETSADFRVALYGGKKVLWIDLLIIKIKKKKEDNNTILV